MKIHILAHRGVWQTPHEQNTLKSFEDAFRNAWGIEFDVRDHQKKLVISHDVANGDECTFEEVLQQYQKIGNAVPLAINIKADGLVDPLKKLLTDYQISNYFVFDMSIPETIRYSRNDVTLFIRRSEFEVYEDNLNASGVWLDNFGAFSDYDNVLQKYLIKNISVALVSPELHKREFHPTWLRWKEILNQYPDYRGRVYLCTDLPQDASTYFEGN